MQDRDITLRGDTSAETYSTQFRRATLNMMYNESAGETRLLDKKKSRSPLSSLRPYVQYNVNARRLRFGCGAFMLNAMSSVKKSSYVVRATAAFLLSDRTQTLINPAV
jgi:hypothetical protein